MPRKSQAKVKAVRAPKTLKTAEEVQKEIDRDVKNEKRRMDASVYRRLFMRNNTFKRPAQVITTKVTKKIVNVEGNDATIEIVGEALAPDRKESKLVDDERKIRRMKNKQRKLLRSRKNRRQHGRSVRVGR